LISQPFHEIVSPFALYTAISIASIALFIEITFVITRLEESLCRITCNHLNQSAPNNVSNKIAQSAFVSRVLFMDIIVSIGVHHLCFTHKQNCAN
jgi:hypothetical protein